VNASYMRASVLSVVGTLCLSAAAMKVAAAPCTLLPDEADQYLASKHSPIAGNGVALVETGKRWNVDPRLVIAIAGQETSFGTNLGCNTQYNAWSFFWNHGHCATSTFSSYANAIEVVTRNLRLRYINIGLTTIPKIRTKYCGSGCGTWVSGVSGFYTALGGDLNDLGCAPECQAAQCGSFVACATASSCVAPVCVRTAEGTGQCVEGRTPCSGLADCTTSRGCGVGSICAVATCCGRNVCVPQSAFCSSNRELVVLALGDQGATIDDEAPGPDLRERGSVGRFGTSPSGNVRALMRVEGQIAVRLGIYDISGRRVRMLLHGEYAAGNYLADWDGRDDRGVTVRPGAYFIRLSLGSQSWTERVVVWR
jgi:hypothetical protein